MQTFSRRPRRWVTKVLNKSRQIALTSVIETFENGEDVSFDAEKIRKHRYMIRC